MADQRPPSFFHILMNPSSPHLPLPPKFVTKHLCNKILEDPIIKSANGGYLWKLKMKKISDQSYCLVDGWCNVVKDVGLVFGEFLLFRYVGSCVFLMHVYSINGCEKILVPKIKVVDYGFICDDDDDVDDEVEEEDDVVYDMDDDNDVEFVIDGEDDDMEEVEDEDDVELAHDGDEDDGMEEDDDVAYDVDDDDHHHVEDEDDVELVHDCDEDDGMEEEDDVAYDVDDDDHHHVEDEDDVELVHDGDEDDGMEEEDDVAYDIDDDGHHHVEDEDDVELVHDGDEDDGMEEEDDVAYDVDDDHHHHVEDEDDVELVHDGDEDDGMEEDDDVLYDVDDDVADEDDIEFVYEVDEDDDVDVDGDDGDPFFILTISKSNTNKLRFSPDFVALARIDTRETIILNNDEGYQKEMTVQSDKKSKSTSYYVATGWKEFQRSNDISEGDKCVFKFITSEDKICLAKITKKKTPARPLPAAAEAPLTEVDADDVEDDDGMDDKDVKDDNDKDEDEDVEPVDDGDDDDPFFVATITTSHKYRLYLPIDFVGLSRIDSKENIIMISLDGSESQMTLLKDKRRHSTLYHLSGGWHAFMCSNNIAQGDKCVFKYITSEDKICLAKIIKALATEVDVEDVNPSFVVTITTMHTTRLPLPPDFIALAGIDNKENITMKNLDGNESQMAVWLDKRFNSAQYNLSLGWVAFKQSNNISQGDECVFKYITSEDKMCLVKITKASATEVNDGMDVEDDNDNDEDENVKLVDDADPFFAVTIIPSQRSVLLLPTDFVALAGIGTKKNIIIKGLDGNETQVTLQSYKLKRLRRYCFSVGWTAFKRSNNISNGDECVLKYIKSEDKMCLVKITKKTTRATLLPAEVDNDDIDDEDVNEEGKGEDAKLVDDDNNESEEDDYDYDGDDGDPSFITISKANQYKLYMPVDFVQSAGINTKKTLTLLGLDGYEKEMPVRCYKSGESKRYYVHKGWSEFKRNNGILEGDKCVFKFITDNDKLFLAKINKKKTPTSPLPPSTDDNDDKDENEDVERVDDEDPFFVATISHRFMLVLPSDFVALAKIDTKENIIIKSLDGNERQMAIQSYQYRLKRYHFSKGWPAFRRSNNISQGDECVFKYIRSEDKMCLVKVTKRKTRSRSSPPATESEVDADDAEDDDGLDDKDAEDDNEDAELVVDDDPFFVVTITQYKFKHRLRMPVDFVRSAGIDTKKTITLKSPDGYEKELPVQFYTKYHYKAKYYFLRKGWMDFARSTNMSVGDKCVFKFITSEDKLCLAKITKAPPTEVDDDDVEVDSGMDDKDADKDVELVNGVDDGDPFFVVTITTTAMLRLPSTFVRLSGIDTKENIIIKSLDGNERLMALRFYQQNNFTRYWLSIGLPAFMRSNSISEGDECVFKYITSEDKMCLAKVTKTKTQTMLSSPAKVVKRKRGRPAKAVKRKRGRPAKITMAENVKITVADVVKRKRGRPAKITMAENVNITVADVVKRKRERPAKAVKRKRGQPTKITMAENVKITVADIVKRKRGRPAKAVKRKRGQPTKITMAENVKITVADVVKRKRGRPAKAVKRKRGRPAKITMAENVKITVADVVKRKRGRPPASPRVIDDVKRKNGQQPRGHSGDVEGVDKYVEVGKRPRGRPAKRLCGNAPQHK